MKLGDEFKIFDWFYISFVENNGMAFGWEFPGGKVLLSIFRVIVVIWGIYYVNELTKKNMPNGVLISLGLVIGGAIGNIIDGVFYGVFFNDSYNKIAEFLPSSGGYEGFLKGRVVDMFHFPIYEFKGVPDWLSLLDINDDGKFLFFSPVFN